MPSFIPDGYVFHAGIKPIEGVHEGLEFHYRPVTPAELAEYQMKAENLNGRELRRHKAKFLCEKVQGWRSPSVDGKPGPQIPNLSEDLLVDGDGKNTINIVLLSQIEDVVMWGAAPDYTIDKDDYQSAVKNSQTASS